MTLIKFAFILWATLAACQMAGWGPRVHLGPAKSEIIALSTVFTPGRPPTKRVPFTALWVGLWNPRSIQYDLVQTVTSSHGDAYMRSLCGSSWKPGQWCTQVYTLHSGRPLTKNDPRTGRPRGFPTDGKDRLLIEYRRNGNWTQSFTNLSKPGVKDVLTAGNLPATVMETGTEMQQQGRTVGTEDTQLYTNLTVTLRTAEPNFGKTFSVRAPATADRPTTKDGGKTWHINKIVLPPYKPGSKGGSVGRVVDVADDFTGPRYGPMKMTSL